ncbi:hypothetical protein HD554DRAFT_2171246 [Boletus coccyginus]|nr:hypothetical protein HD554DRAFT_2171246 [Boletus coccyginus]
MAAEPTLEPTLTREEEQEENDEGGESDSDAYDLEDEGGSYYSEEDEDNEIYDEEPESLTAQLLSKKNGTTGTEEYDDEEDEEDEEYHEGGEGTEKNPIDLSSVGAGSKKRSAEELSEGAADGEGEDEEAEGGNVAKKVRV